MALGNLEDMNLIEIMRERLEIQLKKTLREDLVSRIMEPILLDIETVVDDMLNNISLTSTTAERNLIVMRDELTHYIQFKDKATRTKVILKGDD